MLAALAAPVRSMENKTTKSVDGDGEVLPYRIVLWPGEDRTERVLARATSAQLARAIFRAAQEEHPDRRIAIKRGDQIVADSAEPK
jgi:hypothetical protein